MRDRFSEILSFLKIAEAGSLSIAARRLGLSLPATSRRLSQLEARLGVPLVRRNSRHLTLTEEGMIFYEKAGLALVEMHNAEQAVMRNAVDPAGSLKVVTTISFGRRRLAPLLQRYSALHPEVTVHLETTDQMLSIVESGHDLAICFEPPPDSGLTMKRLADNPRVLCASPDYLFRRGRPSSVSELAEHDHIIVRGNQRDLWRDIGPADLEPRRSLNTNDGELARIWALDGAGIVIKSLWDVAEDIEAGRLQVVLPDIALPASPIVALYTPAQGETAKLRSCLRFLSEQLRTVHGPVPGR
ncbi:MAG: LysR family transcriptional regulator [Sphingobium sp.]